MIYFLSPSPEEFRDKAQTEMFLKCWQDILVKTSCAKRSVAIQVEQLDGKHYRIKGIKTNTWSYFKFFFVCVCMPLFSQFLSSIVSHFKTELEHAYGHTGITFVLSCLCNFVNQKALTKTKTVLQSCCACFWSLVFKDYICEHQNKTKHLVVAKTALRLCSSFMLSSC